MSIETNNIIRYKIKENCLSNDIQEIIYYYEIDLLNMRVDFEINGMKYILEKEKDCHVICIRDLDIINELQNEICKNENAFMDNVFSDNNLFYLPRGLYHIKINNKIIYLVINTWSSKSSGCMFIGFPKKYFIKRNDIKEEFINKYFDIQNDSPYIYISIAKYSNGYANWKENIKQPKRKLESIFINNNIKTNLLDIISNYQKKETIEWHTNNGFIRKLCILLYGPPGTGKSSLIISIASYFNLPIYFIQCGSREITDSIFSDLINSTKDNSIIVFEDVDTLFNKDNVSIGGISFSSFLNTLDGLLFPASRIFILTANRPNDLNQSILRDGRINLALELNYPKKNEYIDFIKYYYPTITTELLHRFEKYVNQEIKHISISLLQEYIKKYYNDINGFLNSIETEKPKRRTNILYDNPMDKPTINIYN